MTNFNLTPRQKMINMMYLVLIALLALNVSREILKSFFLFELSFYEANQKLDSKNNETMNGFNLMMMNEKTKKRTEQWYNLAEEARKVSAEFYAYAEKIKSDIITGGGGREKSKHATEQITELSRPDDMEAHAYYFIDEGKGNGKKLQNRINDTRLKLIGLVSSARNGKRIQASLLKSSQLAAVDQNDNTENKKTWVSTYLENAPLAGVVTLLTKVQNDCKALEADVLNVLSENINIESVTTNGQMAIIMPENQAVMSGEDFKARVALAIYDTRSESQMYVNGKLIKVQNGLGEISIPAHGTGSHQVQAEIESIDPKTGLPVMIQSDIMVWNSFQATATISADNMNVLFRGLNNPLSISIPGITPGNTVVNSNNGISIVNEGNGKYTAKVSGHSNSGSILVSARMADGSIKKMGEMVYRLRNVPEPKLKYGKFNPGTHEKSKIRTQQYLYAVLEDFYFKDVVYKITKYHAALFVKKGIMPPDVTENSSSLSRVNLMLNGARSGDALIIDNIHVQGPSGEIRIDPITFIIK